MAAEYVLKHVLKHRCGPLVLSTFVTGVGFVSLHETGRQVKHNNKIL